MILTRKYNNNINGFTVLQNEFKYINEIHSLLLRTLHKKHCLFRDGNFLRTSSYALVYSWAEYCAPVCLSSKHIHYVDLDTQIYK